MQETEAYHAAGQGRPSLLNHREPVVPNSQSPQSLQPTDCSLHDPSHLPQAATMRRTPPCDMRINAEPGEYPTRRVTIEPSIGVRFIGKFLGPPRLACDLGKVDYQRHDLLMVADVGPSDADAKGHAMPIDHQGVFGPLFPAVHGA